MLCMQDKRIWKPHHLCHISILTGQISSLVLCEKQREGIRLAKGHQTPVNSSCATLAYVYLYHCLKAWGIGEGEHVVLKYILWQKILRSCRFALLNVGFARALSIRKILKQPEKHVQSWDLDKIKDTKIFGLFARLSFVVHLDGCLWKNFSDTQLKLFSRLCNWALTLTVSHIYFSVRWMTVALK